MNSKNKDWMKKLWNWADKYNISQNIIPRDKENLKKITSLKISGVNDGINPPIKLPIKIPKEIGYLINLKEVEFTFCNLTELPKEIGHLTNLVNLELAWNHITELPKEIGYLKSLKRLSIGSIVYDEDWNNPSQCLNSTNCLTKLPESIFTLYNLEELTIGHIPGGDYEGFGNRITYISKNIKNLKKLNNILELSYNQLTELPEDICSLTELTQLMLDFNNLNKLPNNISNLVNLELLWVSDNSLIELPEQIINLNNLKRLNLSNNPNLILTEKQKIWIKGLINKYGLEYYGVMLDDDLLGRNKEIQNNPITINGNWKAGWTLDIHTLKSIPLDDGKFDTTYTETGKALNELKYHQNYTQIEILANEVIEFLKTRMVTPYLDVIIPAPPSKDREIQPVIAIAEKVSKALNIPIDINYILKNKNTGELKTIDDPLEREKILHNAFNLQDLRYQNKKILLFDDLYRSGSTLKELTNILYCTGKVNNIYVVTLTKTRTKR